MHKKIFDNISNKNSWIVSNERENLKNIFKIFIFPSCFLGAQLKLIIKHVQNSRF